ncbi:MAG: ribose-phosphate pyrophosphokinase [candidate division KSB1 bacterium]|nr:ribose-phosphate pyrophosphokinase [candidate division KSB1 bacterium]
MPEKLKVFYGSANVPLAEKICRCLRVKPGAITRKRFSDGEIWVKYEENIRGADCFLIQPTNAPAENLMELLVMIDAARRASAKRITAVIPYFGYARQDRKDQPRVAITAKLVANLLTTAGADRVLTMDLHAPQLQGFFDIPVDHLYSAMVACKYVQNLRIPDLVIVSPDVGGIQIARAYARRLHAPLAVVDKRRPRPNVAEVHTIIGDVAGKNVMLVDDIVDTGNTLCESARFLKNRGAKEVYALCTHAVLSGSAIDNIRASELSFLVVTDTIALPPEKRIDKLRVISVADVFAEGIERIHKGDSISKLFSVN